MHKPSKHEKTSDLNREVFGEAEPKDAPEAEHETRSLADDRTQLVGSGEQLEDDATVTPSGNTCEPPAPIQIAQGELTSPDTLPPRDLALGEESKRYVDWELVGEGGFGVVYRARDSRLQRDVAIKILKPDTPAELRERFLDEARRLAGLNHPGICRVYDYGQAETSYLVTEWLPGPALDDTTLPMEAAEACRLVAEVADAIAFAHRHEVIHRDLKPANIVIDGHGRPRVIDFGLAAHEDDLTSSGRQFSGSPAYMSPEQTTGKLHLIDARSDIWALGVVLYELVTGKRPFRGTRSEDLLSKIREKPTPPARVYNDDVPAQLETVIARCLHKDPEDRFATASELANALKEVVNDMDSTVATPKAIFTLSTETKRRKQAVAAVLVAIGCLLVGGVWYSSRSGRTDGLSDRNDVKATQPERELPEREPIGNDVQALAASSPPVASKVSFVVEGVRKATGNRWTLSRENPVAPNIQVGDRISLHVGLAERRHVYLIWLGADSGITPLYPGPLGSTSHVGDPEIDHPIEQLTLPVGTITPTPSTETVLMIATDQPFSKPADLRELLAVLPRPSLSQWAAQGNTRGVHFDADTWDEQASNDGLLREAFLPLKAFVEKRFGESVTIQTVSFVSGIQ